MTVRPWAVLLAASTAGDAQAAARVGAAARAQGWTFEIAASPASLLARVQGRDGPGLVVLAPGTREPVRVARRVHGAAPRAGFLFLVEADEEAPLRRQLVYSTPSGAQWSIECIAAGHLEGVIASTMASIAEQRRLRTTLDHISARVATYASVPQAEYARLVASERFLASVLRHMHDAVVAVDPSGLVVSCNTSAARLFRRLEHELAGVSLPHLLGQPSWWARALDEALAGGAPQHEVALETDAGPAVLEVTLSAVPGPAHGIEGYAAILRDVTRQKHTEEQLRELNRRKDQFLAMLAHELRNPLAPIRSAAEIIRLLPVQDARLTKVSEVISRQVGHMTRIIDELLDVSRVTRGKIELTREPLDLRAAVASAVEQVRPLLDQRGHRLHLTLPGEPVHVLGDAVRLVQVVGNLLNNAAKYTSPGGDVHLRVVPGAHEVQVTVEDTGEGIDPQFLPHVFELFTQSHRSPDRSESGMGVGLALVRHLVELHGGRVEAHSEGPGHGSRFSVTLPAWHATPDAAPPAPAPREAGGGPGIQPLRLLVVDDNRDAAFTLAAVLEADGHEVRVALDAHEALATAPGFRPDVLLLDLGLPGLDGYALAERLRACEATARSIYVAVSGYSAPQDRERARRAGFDHHLAKPVPVEQVRAVLQGARRVPGC